MHQFYIDSWKNDTQFLIKPYTLSFSLSLYMGSGHQVFSLQVLFHELPSLQNKIGENGSAFFDFRKEFVSVSEMAGRQYRRDYFKPVFIYTQNKQFMFYIYSSRHRAAYVLRLLIQTQSYIFTFIRLTQTCLCFTVIHLDTELFMIYVYSFRRRIIYNLRLFIQTQNCLYFTFIHLDTELFMIYVHSF